MGAVLLVAGLALLPVATAWWGAVAALALLALFLAAIAFSFARGRRPDCHCFGQLHSAPIGSRTVIRNPHGARSPRRGAAGPGPRAGSALPDRRRIAGHGDSDRHRSAGAGGAASDG
jgi:hypothetical protein